MKNILLLSLIITVTQAIAQTNVSGFINANTTWNISGSPYLITGNALLSQGYTLTIEPGVIVKFSSNTALQIDGQLIAVGNSQNRIIFTSSQATPQAGDWGKLHISDMATDAVLDNNGNYISGTILKYCDVLYAGSLGAGAIHIESSSPYFNQCRVKYSSASGILCSNGVCSVDSSVITNCVHYGLYFDQAPTSCSGILNVRNDSIVNNLTGGILILQWPNCMVRIEGNYFSSNGQGLYITGTGSCSSFANSVGYDRIYITGNDFISNTLGAIYLEGLADLKITGNQFANNNSDSYSGIVTLNVYSRATITENYFHDNTVEDYHSGSCLYYGKTAALTLSGSNTILECNRFIHNEARQNGAGAFSLRCSGRESIKNNLIEGNFNNTAGYCSAAYIYSSAADTVQFSNNIIRNNSAPSGSCCVFYPNLATNNQLLRIANNEFASNNSQYVMDLEGQQINNSSYDFLYLKYNNFLDVGVTEIYNHIPYGSPNIHADNNFWGSANTAHTDSIIYDYFDDATNSVVYYSPILSSQVQIDTSCSQGSTGFASVSKEEFNIVLYPNPASTQLFVQSSEEIQQINIYNTTGSLVSQTKQPQTNSIDISGLPAGVYVAEIKTKETSIKRRWVKL